MRVFSVSVRTHCLDTKTLKQSQRLRDSFCYATPPLPSSFSLIYIQIDLEVNQMSLFSGSQRTCWDNEIRVRWVLHLHKRPDGTSPLMQRLRFCVGAQTRWCEWGRACVRLLMQSNLTSSIYLANKKNVNVCAHVWSFLWQLRIGYMLPLWL